MVDIMVSPRSMVKVNFANKRTRRINRVLIGEMETNRHSGGLRSMDEIDPQTNQRLSAISLGKIVWTKKIFLRAIGNMHK